MDLEDGDIIMIGIFKGVGKVILGVIFKVIL